VMVALKVTRLQDSGKKIIIITMMLINIINYYNNNDGNKYNYNISK
jgi:hypothetical protein